MKKKLVSNLITRRFLFNNLTKFCDYLQNFRLKWYNDMYIENNNEKKNLFTHFILAFADKKHL